MGIIAHNATLAITSANINIMALTSAITKHGINICHNLLLAQLVTMSSVTITSKVGK